MYFWLCFRFVLHFICQSTLNGDRTMSVLNVIETNPFKHLTHLSLKFFPGTDSDVKKYLADCLKQLRVKSHFTSFSRVLNDNPEWQIFRLC